jgi:hypothetical protein
MAATSGTRQHGAFDPPPSSILAIRIANQSAVPKLNQASFDQLLAESLGNDENGQPNLGSDVTIILKVVEIVLKAGIEPALVLSNDDPFSGGPNRAAESQFLSCLEVIRTAIERSPKVLLENTATDGPGSPTIPLYNLLIPKLLSSFTPHVSRERSAALEQTILACLRGSVSPGPQALRLVVLEFILGCVSGKCSKRPASINMR